MNTICQTLRGYMPDQAAGRIYYADGDLYAGWLVQVVGY